MKIAMKTFGAVIAALVVTAGLTSSAQAGVGLSFNFGFRIPRPPVVVTYAPPVYAYPYVYYAPPPPAYYCAPPPPPPVVYYPAPRVYYRNYRHCY